MPISNAPLIGYLHSEYKIKRFQPDATLVWSKGKLFEFRSANRINNFGQPRDDDFETNPDRPLLFVVGDSYVEAAQVSNSGSLHSLLHREVSGMGAVYAIGSSGAPLSTYLKYAEIARTRFKPDAMVFVIVGNDFDESMCKYHNAGIGIWCFEQNSRKDLVLKHRVVADSQIRALAKQSAIFRYLAFNLGLNWRSIFKSAFEGSAEQEQFVGNTAATVSDERIRLSIKAIDEFLQRVQQASGLPRNRIAFAIDADRQKIYATYPGNAGSYFEKMRNYFIAAARSQSFEIIDLEESFSYDFKLHSEQFEFPVDGHWNERGHRVAASAISASKVFQAEFGRVKAD